MKEKYIQWKKNSILAEIKHKQMKATMSVEVFDYKNVKGEENKYIKFTNSKGKQVVMGTSVIKANTLKEIMEEDAKSQGNEAAEKAIESLKEKGIVKEGKVVK